MHALWMGDTPPTEDLDYLKSVVARLNGDWGRVYLPPFGLRIIGFPR